MKLPIILDNRGDVLVFDDLDQAKKYVEPIDVINGEYVGYDATGRILMLDATEENNVIIELEEPVMYKEVELRNVLISFLIRLKPAKHEDRQLRRLHLNQLIEIILEYKT